LRALVARLRPKLLLLDPLVRLHALDENSSHEIAAFLGYFRDLQRTFDTAVILAHHTSKKARPHPGQSLRGSSDLHAFGDSNAYLFQKAKRIVLVREHRAAKAIPPLTLEIVSNGDVTHLCVREGADPATHPQAEPSLEDRVVELLRSHEQPMSRTDLRARLRVNNQRLADTLRALEANQRVRRDAGRWSPAPANPDHGAVPFPNLTGSAGNGTALSGSPVQHDDRPLPHCLEPSSPRSSGVRFYVAVPKTQGERGTERLNPLLTP